MPGKESHIQDDENKINNIERIAYKIWSTNHFKKEMQRKRDGEIGQYILGNIYQHSTQHSVKQNEHWPESILECSEDTVETLLFILTE